MNTTLPTSNSWAHRLTTIAAWFSVTIMALGIGALAYQTRVLHLDGEFWSWFALVVAFAPATSTAVVGAYKFFAVSDSEHDKFLWVAFGIDLAAIFSQLLSVALTGTQDVMLGAIRIVAFTLSALSFVAVMLAAGTSGYRLKMVNERERQKQVEKAFDTTLMDVLKSDETYRHMQALSAHVLRERFQSLTGKRIETYPGEFDSPAHAGSHPDTLNPFKAEFAEPLLRTNGNGNGKKAKGINDPNA